MVQKYVEFINEAKIADYTIGARVLLKGYVGFYFTPKDIGQLSMNPNLGIWNSGSNLSRGKQGVVKEIKKVKQYGSTSTWIVIELDEPIELKQFYIGYIHGSPRYVNENVSTISINYTQFSKVKPLTADYEETERKLKEGEIAKYTGTGAFNYIMKEIGFKKKGDYFDISHFDVVKDNFDVVSFIPSKKAIKPEDKSKKDTKEESKTKDKSKKDSESKKEKWTKEKYRQQSRIGRVLRKLNPDLNDKEIEKFVDEYKSAIESYYKTSDVEVVTGDKISYWYNSKRYKTGHGSLNNSCMRGEGVQIRIKNFYDKYPEKIALAIKTNDKGQLLARALIWRLDDGRVYMDRIYSVTAKDGNHIRNYGEKYGMLMRGKSHGVKTVTIPDKDFNTDIFFSYPYLDSFRAYYDKNKKEHVLTSYLK